jgi:hypothetical protein
MARQYEYIGHPEQSEHLCPAELRFIEAFTVLQRQGLVTLPTFAADNGVSVASFCSFRRGLSHRKARAEWFTYLCTKGVRAEWLLTGKGKMLKK